MVDIEEVYVRDLFKKQKVKIYKEFSTLSKKIYQDDCEM